MKPLPPSVASVPAPVMWSPSLLVQGTECRYRALLAASEDAPSLISHPRAAVGAVVHRLLENAARGTIQRTSNLYNAVIDEFNRLLSEKESTLKACFDTAHFGNLSATFSDVDWHNHMESHISAAISLLSNAPPYRDTRPTSTRKIRRFQDLKGAGKWPEVSIHSDSLKLAGRMDHVEITTDNSIVIRDYKGGRVLDNDGNVLASIQLQLRLYGLAVLSHRPRASINLIVSSGSHEHHVEFGKRQIEDTKSWLVGFLETLRPTSQQSSDKHATPGSACSQCQKRHVCPAYQTAAPGFWEEGLPDNSRSFDTWGEVVDVCFSNDLTSLDIHTASSRKVRVQRLETSRHGLLDVRKGCVVWLFGLASSRKRVVNGRKLQPRNFFELPINRSHQRAWSLTAFGHNVT